MRRPRTLAAAAAAAAALLLLLVEGPSPAAAGLLRNVKLTEEQQETVRKVDELLNQLLENIRRMFYKKNPGQKPFPHEGFAHKNYSMEANTTQELNPGTSGPVEAPLHTNLSKGNDAQKGMDPGRDRQEPFSGNAMGAALDYDGSRIRFPDD